MADLKVPYEAKLTIWLTTCICHEAA